MQKFQFHKVQFKVRPQTTILAFSRFQFHKVQFKESYQLLDITKLAVFQFHKVQFKGLIPEVQEGAIPSFNSIRYNLKTVLKAGIKASARFQFHKVQFKVSQ